jgi:formate hydrogenlyase transcriptional activator
LTSGSTLRVDESFVRIAPARPIAAAGKTLADVERAHILEIIEECGGRIKGGDNAAARLGLNPSTLRSRMKKLGIEPRRRALTDLPLNESRRIQ